MKTDRRTGSGSDHLRRVGALAHAAPVACNPERLRREGFAGATVVRGIAGFGANSILHTSHILELSEDLPVIVVIVDTEEMIGKLEPILDEMLGEGLVTMEKVRVLRYGK